MSSDPGRRRSKQSNSDGDPRDRLVDECDLDEHLEALAEQLREDASRLSDLYPSRDASSLVWLQEGNDGDRDNARQSHEAKPSRRHRTVALGQRLRRVFRESTWLTTLTAVVLLCTVIGLGTRFGLPTTSESTHESSRHQGRHESPQAAIADAGASHPSIAATAVGSEPDQGAAEGTTLHSIDSLDPPYREVMYYATEAEMEGILDLWEKQPRKKITISF